MATVGIKGFNTIVNVNKLAVRFERCRNLYRSFYTTQSIHTI